MKRYTINIKNPILISVIIILLVILSIFILILIKETHSTRQWYNSISTVAEHKDGIRQIQIISHTPDGSAIKNIEPEKYSDYIDFLQSLKVSFCDNTDLSGTSVELKIRCADSTEFRTLFMGSYINFNNRYYKIENYSEINNVLQNLYFSPEAYI